MGNSKMMAADSDILAFAALLQDELTQGLALYWKFAGETLDKSGVNLNPPSEDCFSLENNFFSALFLYSYVRAGLSKPRRILFAAVNQCLRGMVTGCDNILDNEYKTTLDTDLPENAVKFRSILDIMVSDRILMGIMNKGYQDGAFGFDHILQAGTASLHALLKSGVQEASEEEGVDSILAPQEVLDKVHALKTGILFQAPWVIPELIQEGEALNCVDEVKKGLYQIGMGCQILDDMVDLSLDIRMNRHNYVASLISHGSDISEQKILNAYLDKNDNRIDPDFLFKFPRARLSASKIAKDLLRDGTQLLFDPEHQFMVAYSIDFFIRRIGAHRFFTPK